MEAFVKSLTWTLIHSLWQGLLAALLSAIILSSTRKASASLRYNLLGAVMILFFAASVFTFVIQSNATVKQLTPVAAIVSDDAVIISSANGVTENLMVWVNSNSYPIVVIWAFLFLFSCLRLVTGLAAVNRLRHFKTQPITIEWRTKLRELQLLIGVRCSVSLLQSALVKVPMTLGILKPVILVPLGMITHLPAEQVETILLHELAHIRRRDYLVNLLQHIAEAIFFFNPAIRWISSLIRQEREACCDDMVLASCKQKTNYLNALINFQEYSFNHSTHALGFSSKRNFLLNRVKRMITNNNTGISFFEKIALLGGVLLFSAFGIITKETETKETPAVMQQTAAAIVPAVINQPAYVPVKKKRISILNRPPRDTIPAKKVTNTKKDRVEETKAVIKLNEREQTTKDAAATLQEIIQLKNQIGQKKECVGEMKEQLKTKDWRERRKILKEIERERDEINTQRRVLNAKREQLETLKEKAKEQQAEEKQSDNKTIIDKERTINIANNHSNQWDKPDQWNKSNEWDRSDQWDRGEQRIKNDRTKVERKPAASTANPKFNSGIDINKYYKQELKYKIDLQLKDPPSIKPKPAPDELKSPGAPAKKAAAAKPYTAN